MGRNSIGIQKCGYSSLIPRFDLIICSYINEYCSNIFMSSAAKSVLGNLLLSDVTIKTTTYNRQTTPYISYIYTVLHTLGYKIKSLTLLKQINLTKQTRAKLASNSVSLPLVTVTRSTKYEGCFVSSVRLWFRASLGC